MFILHSCALLLTCLFQEFGTEKILSMTGNKKDMTFALLIPFVDCITTTLFSLCVIATKKNTKHVKFTKKDFFINIACGAFYATAVFLMSLSVNYLPYPLKILLSSAKLLIAMPASFIINGSKKKTGGILGYSYQEIIVSLMLFSGLVIVLLSPKAQQGLLENVSWLGIMLVVVSTNFNSFFDELQSKLLKKGHSMNLILACNMPVAALFLFLFIVVNHKLEHSIELMKENPKQLAGIVLISIFHLMGQIMIISLKQKYGIWWKNVATSLRKCLSLILSVVFFGHKVTPRQTFGIIVVFVSVFWAGNIEMTRKSSPKVENQPEKSKSQSQSKKPETQIQPKKSNTKKHSSKDKNKKK